MSREQPTRRHGCTVTALSHCHRLCPDPTAPSFQYSTFPRHQGSQQLARAASGDAGSREEPPSLRSPPWADCPQGLQMCSGSNPNAAKFCNLPAAEDADSITNGLFRRDSAHTDFQVGGVNSLGTRSAMRPDTMPAGLRMWGLGSERCVCHSLQG